MNLYRRLLAMVKPYWLKLVGAMICMVFVSFLTAAQAFLVNETMHEVAQLALRQALRFGADGRVTAACPAFMVAHDGHERDSGEWVGSGWLGRGQRGFLPDAGRLQRRFIDSARRRRDRPRSRLPCGRRWRAASPWSRSTRGALPCGTPARGSSRWRRSGRLPRRTRNRCT